MASLNAGLLVKTLAQTRQCGRMFYIYPQKNLRIWPGTLRGTPEWDETYKIRAAVEKEIGLLKDSGCAAGRKTRDAKTIHAIFCLPAFRSCSLYWLLTNFTNINS